MQAAIKNKGNPLYIVEPDYFPTMEGATLSETEGHVEGIAFMGMADHESQGEHKEQEPYFDYGEQQHRDDLHRRKANRATHPVYEVWRLAWED